VLTLFQAPQMMPKWFHSDNRDIQRRLEIGYTAKKRGQVCPNQAWCDGF